MRMWCGLAAAVVMIVGAAFAQDLPPTIDEPPILNPGGGASTGKGPARESNPIAEIETLRPHYDDVQARHAERMAEVSDAKVIKAIQTGADALLKRLTATMAGGDPKAALSRQLTGQEVIVEPSKEGVVPMTLYALLVVGRAIEDERFVPSSKELAPAIKYTMELKSNLTYSNSVQAIALSMMPANKDVVAAMTGAKTRLMANMWKDGAFGYAQPNVDYASQGPEFRDGSNSQFALLGMWACDEAGVAVPETFWKISDQMWRSRQAPNGGWGYEFLPGQTGKALVNMETRQTMTAAGVASLYVTASRLNKTVTLEPKTDPAMKNGVACLERNFELMRTYMGTNPYFSYSMERVARASGKKYFAAFDWFREGAAEIIASQDKGVWSDIVDPYPYGGTCFALLFLARGSAPVAFNKLQYPGAWDARPQDVANLTRWIEKKSERVLNWEIVDVDSTVEKDWADAPILVIAGHGDPNFSDAQMKKLRKFVEEGGIIFSTADGGDAIFSEKIKTKYAPMICDKQYAMRTLEKTHPIYTLDIKAGSARTTELWGMSNGARELWIHAPKDMGAVWQSQAESSKEGWDLPANLLTYASGRLGLRRRLESLFVEAPTAPPTRKLSVARVKYEGNWNPEPGAWPRFVRTAALARDTALTVTTTGFAELDAKKTPIVHVTGTEALKLTDGDRAALKKYLAGGGFVIADSAGGSKAFGESIQAELSKAGATLTAIEELEKHPLASELKTVELRRFCLTPENVQKKMKVYEVTVSGWRVGAVFDGDVTSGLTGTNHWGVLGYSAKTSEGMMWNAVQKK
jgi:hypothetical protein